MSSGSVPLGITPCVGGGSFVLPNVTQIQVLPGQVVNVTFGGTPPFNLTQSVWLPDEATIACNVRPTNISTNTYTWTVASFDYLGAVYDQIGNAVMFGAIETTPLSDGQYAVYTSANYTIVNQTSSTSPTSTSTGGSLPLTGGLGWKGISGIVLLGMLCIPIVAI